MSNDLAVTIPCPVCHEAQLNRDLLRVHLIEMHGWSVENAAMEAHPLARMDDLFNAFHEARKAVEREEARR